MRIGFFLLWLFVSSTWADGTEFTQCFNEVCPEAACTAEPVADQNRFSIQGNQLIPAKQLQRIIASALSNPASLAKAELARRRVSEYYACLGYINSGAILKTDDQGRFIYQMIEGTIQHKDISVEGDVTAQDKRHIRQVLLAGEDQETLNIHAVRDRLARLKRIGLYHNIKADISPKSLGKAALQVQLERKPNDLSGQVFIDNHQSDFVGRERIGFDLSYRGFDDPAHTLSAGGSLSEGLKSAQVTYQAADYQGDSISFTLSHSESVIIQSPLDDLEIKNTTDKLSLTGYAGLWSHSRTGRYAAESSQNNTLGALLTAELLQSRNTLLGRGFSFSGIVNLI